MAIENSFNSLITTLLSSINSEIITDGNYNFSDSTELLSFLKQKVSSGEYSSDQIGEAAKNIVNSLSTELNSGKYTTEQIGQVAKTYLSSMGTEISTEISKLSNSEIGEEVKEYVNTTKTSFSRMSVTDLGDNIKNNFSKYVTKIQDHSLTLDDLDTIATQKKSGLSSTTTTSSTTTKKSKSGTAIAKSTKKTTKKISTTTKKKTTVKNKTLKDKTNSTRKTTLTPVTKTVIADSGNAIYFDHDRAHTNANTIQECYEAIARDNKEIQSILTDLSSFWKGSLATKFTNQFEDYIDKINKYNECLQDGYDNLKNGSKAYSEFDDYFASKSI